MAQMGNGTTWDETTVYSHHHPRDGKRQVSFPFADVMMSPNLEWHLGMCEPNNLHTDMYYADIFIYINICMHINVYILPPGWNLEFNFGMLTKAGQLLTNSNNTHGVDVFDFTGRPAPPSQSQRCNKSSYSYPHS